MIMRQWMQRVIQSEVIMGAIALFREQYSPYVRNSSSLLGNYLNKSFVSFLQYYHQKKWGFL